MGIADEFRGGTYRCHGCGAMFKVANAAPIVDASFDADGEVALRVFHSVKCRLGWHAGNRRA